ncbi:MAG: methylated-DNA--[protein]-cysteine S-methyltransferase [Bacteroidetes bacterium]|nr:methylated-DNA--[protein]-cysteine S-methyltransferase [Bacteroidota bacterium]
MNNLPSIRTMYNALVTKDITYEGIFYVGVKTTGIFCRPSCSAKKPELRNIEFFPSTKDALLAGYRPCKRCSPMQPLGNTPNWLKDLLEELKVNNLSRWKDSDLRKKNFDPNRVRRWFKKNHNMTFHAYVRSLRLGEALGRLKHGEGITQTAFDHGYESLSGFRDAIKKITGMSAGKSGNRTIVYLNRILTPLGPMLAGATNEGICLLEFMDRRMLNTQLKTLMKRLNCNFVPGTNSFIDQLAEELKNYFKGTLKNFSIPIIFPGTDFQKLVWKNLINISSGETISYEELAIRVGNISAVRAVAKANGDNRIAIIIPCHRVIGKDGSLTGYGGGLWRKKYLIELESKNL